MICLPLKIKWFKLKERTAQSFKNSENAVQSSICMTAFNFGHSYHKITGMKLFISKNINETQRTLLIYGTTAARAEMAWNLACLKNSYVVALLFLKCLFSCFISPLSRHILFHFNLSSYPFLLQFVISTERIRKHEWNE